jgi:hypothetical protein
MIEFAGLIYTFGKEAFGYVKDGKEVFDFGKGLLKTGKDIKEHFDVKEGEPKLVNFEWVSKSGFQAELEAKGYNIAFSRPEKVASRELDGYEVMYELKKDSKTRHKIVLNDGSVLIGRKKLHPIVQGLGASEREFRP